GLRSGAEQRRAYVAPPRGALPHLTRHALLDRSPGSSTGPLEVRSQETEVTAPQGGGRAARRRGAASGPARIRKKHATQGRGEAAGHPARSEVPRSDGDQVHQLDDARREEE